MKKSFFVIILLLVMLCGCESWNPQKQEKEVLLVAGVSKYYEPSQTPDFTHITGGPYAQCHLQTITEILESDSLVLKEESSFGGEAYAYEMVLVMPKKEYYDVVQKGGKDEDIPVLVALAYSYRDRQAYVFQNDKIYSVTNMDFLQNKIGSIFADSGTFSDTKFFWSKADAITEHPVEGTEKSSYSWNFSFRYERFWCLDQPLQKNDFTTLKGYDADNMEAMITNAAVALGYSEYKAYVADDILTGYWRVEFYNLSSDAHSLIYFDDSFDVLFGIMY